jgi:hypothetical protein
MTADVIERIIKYDRRIAELTEGITQSRLDIARARFEADAMRWAQAELISGLLKPQGNSTLVEIGSHIGRSHQHVALMAKAWRSRQEGDSWSRAYQRAKAPRKPRRAVAVAIDGPVPVCTHCCPAHCPAEGGGR